MNVRTLSGKSKVRVFNWFIAAWLLVYMAGFVFFIVVFPGVDFGGVNYETISGSWLKFWLVGLALGWMARRDLKSWAKRS